MDILRKYLPALVFIIVFGWALRVLLLPNYPDFQVHYYGAQHLVKHENPYLPDSNYYTPQVYPPFDMVFFMPLSFLPYEIATKIWITISIAAVVISIFLINKKYKIPLFSSTSLFLASLVFLAFPTKFTFGMGQINAIILLLTTLFWYYFNSRNEIKSGIAFAFAAMLKFFPLLLIPYLIILKRWKLLRGLVATVAGLFIVSLFFVPFEIQLHFFQKLLPELLASWKGDYYNQSFVGLLMRSTFDELSRQLLRMIVPAMLLVTAFGIILLKRYKDRIRINLEISLLIITTLLINNFSWQHHFVLLLLPFFILFYTIKNAYGSQQLYIPLFVSYILIAINFPEPKALPELFQSHVFFGGLLLWILNLFMLVSLSKEKAKL